MIVLVSIEVKLNIGGDLDAAIATVAPPSHPRVQRDIWFVEHAPGIASGEPSLYRSHVILRIRTGDEATESTVKLRPLDPALLKGPWRAERKDQHEGFDYRIEGDWSGTRHVLAASAVLARDAALAASAPARAFNRRQRQFLERCAGVDLAGLELVALGPVASTKWADVPFGNRTVSMERWTVGPLDFLELSIRIKKKPGDTADRVRRRATRRQADLEAAALALGLALDANSENKTQRVLHHLATTAHPAGYAATG